MAQLTIYLDDETRQRIEEAAQRAGVSVSSWVKDRLKSALGGEWPPGYFDLFGSLADCDLEEPEDLPWELDIPREDL